MNQKKKTIQQEMKSIFIFKKSKNNIYIYKKYYKIILKKKNDKIIIIKKYKTHLIIFQFPYIKKKKFFFINFIC